MNNRKILELAMEQSAIDLNCTKNDFEKTENVIVTSRATQTARKYLQLPFDCNLVTYGNNIVASINSQYFQLVKDYLDRCDAAHCFETPNMYILNESFAPYGLKICFMAEYFLPNLNALKELPCDFELRVLKQSDFTNLYNKNWSNALCADRKELDILGIGAYDKDTLVGLAACSADCDTMWQIGVDVLPEYRRKGIASSITSKLSIEILKQDKVPFYCCAWCNLKSARNAIKSGFRPAWAEMTIKSNEFISITIN